MMARHLVGSKADQTDAPKAVRLVSMKVEPKAARTASLWVTSMAETWGYELGAVLAFAWDDDWA